MGTETKFNCYSENSTTGGSIPKVFNGSSSGATAVIGKAHTNGSVRVNGVNGSDKQQQQQHQQQQPQQQQHQQQQQEHQQNDSKVSVIAIQPNHSENPYYVPIRIDENNVIDGAKEILKVIRPHWDLNKVKFKKFTDGITNKLVGCFNTSQTKPTTNGANGSNGTNGIISNGNSNLNGSSTNGYDHGFDDNNDSGHLSDADSNDTDTTNSESSEAPTDIENDGVVLVRVYGNKTDLLIDRKAETRNILLLHTYGFAPSLYATFKNGLAYDYVPGITLNTRIVMEPEVWRLVACRMAEMHRVVKLNGVDGTGGGGGGAGAGGGGGGCGGGGNGSCHGAKGESLMQPVPMLWKKAQKFFDLVPERFSDAEKHKRIEGTFLPISRLREDFTSLYKRLEALCSPVVFAHNDLLLGNIVYMESQKSVNFIDYEYADYNFQAYDIGNHFCEFAGVDEVDYSRYPTREFQLEWLRVYLQTYLRRTHVSDTELERLYVQVNQFALAAHFFWTIWSLIQAEHSTIDFDYVEYAFLRYNEYMGKKDEFLALDANINREESS